jgi:nucleoside-diphosphate-sugar epimerase
MEKEKILIVGAKAEAAKFIATDYAKNGFEIYGVSRDLILNNQKYYKKVENYFGNFKEYTFKKVFVLASRLPSQGGELADFLTDNLFLLEWTKINCGAVEKIIYFSSFSVYDKNETIICNNSKYTKNDYYGTSKLVAESYAVNNFKSTMILRIPVLLCAGVKNNFAAKLKLAVEHKQSFEFENLSSNVNTFFNLQDLTEIEKKYENGIINCGTKIDWSIKDIADYAMECGLKSYSERPTTKLPQKVKLTDDSIFSSTKDSIINFLKKN